MGNNKKIKNRERKARQRNRNPEKEEILKEAESLQEDTASDSDVSMEDKPATDDLNEKLDESMLEDSEDDKVKDYKKEEIVELPTSCPVCKKPCKQLFMHFNSKKHCKQSIHPDELEFLEYIRNNNKKIK